MLFIRLPRWRRISAANNRAEPVPPQPHGFVTDIYAAIEEQVLYFPQRKREADVHPYGEVDHLGR